MKNLLLVAAFLLTGYFGFSQQVYVNGYTKSNGTYVQGHYRTSPNSTVNDNWSTSGNVNPYTGKTGTKPRANTYSTPKTYSYSNSIYSTPKTRTTTPKSTYTTYSSYPTYTPAKTPKFTY